MNISLGFNRKCCEGVKNGQYGDFTVNYWKHEEIIPIMINIKIPVIAIVNDFIELIYCLNVLPWNSLGL